MSALPVQDRYVDLLARKRAVVGAVGREVAESAVNPLLFPFQRALVRWAMRKGRCALFADTGLGKTFMQLEWARLMGGRSLIVAPLSVARQTVAEGGKLGLDVHYTRSGDDLTDGVNITNYEMVEHFDPDAFQSVVLDESSILKAVDGTTRQRLTEMFAATPYRLCCTATPAPNDIAEIANHAEFIGVMTRARMLSAFFVHDSNDSARGGWRLKGHARQPFFRWMASWGMSVRRPSDLGYSDEGYDLPPLNITPLFVPTGYRPAGELIFTGLKGIQDRAKVRKETVTARVQHVVELINGSARVQPGVERCEPRARAGVPPPHGGAPERSATREVRGVNRGAGEGEDIVEYLPQGESAQASSVDVRADGAGAGGDARGRVRGVRSPLDKASYRSLPQDGQNARGAVPIVQPGAGASSGRSGARSGVAGVPEEAWIVWCGLNAEQDALARAFGERAISITGSLSPEEKEARLVAWLDGERPILISKPSICGFGLNLQRAHKIAFVGLSDSYESYYQAIRRCWRFGQRSPVDVLVVLAEEEDAVYENVMRKEVEAARMTEELIASVREYEREEIGNAPIEGVEYQTDEARGPGWRLLLGDSVERMAEVETDSVGLSVFSPPFLSLYTYSPSERDIGNCQTDEEFYAQFGYVIGELLRVTMPGRNCCVHVAQVPTTKVHDGVIGMKDFRGDVIRQFVARGWIYHGEVCIDKDPQAQAIRTKSKGLMFVQMDKDSSWLRPACADYILVFRKPGENAVPVTPEMTRDEWISWARPIWYGIRESETLNAAEAREHADEKHVAPLQLETIERCIRLWSNAGETVLSPFAGIGSEGYVAVKKRRQFVGIELKGSYYRAAVRNLTRAVELREGQLGLFADAP